MLSMTFILSFSLASIVIPAITFSVYINLSKSPSFSFISGDDLLSKNYVHFQATVERYQYFDKYFLSRCQL